MRKINKKYPFNQATINSLQDIGKMIQQIRKESKLTQKKTAQLCGVTPKFLSELETGKNKHFSLRLVLRVIHFFGIQIICKKRTIK